MWEKMLAANFQNTQQRFIIERACEVACRGARLTHVAQVGELARKHSTRGASHLVEEHGRLFGCIG